MAVDQALGALHRQRLAGTDLAVQFQKAILIASWGSRSVIAGSLPKDAKNLGLLSEQIQNLRDWFPHPGRGPAR